MGRSRSYAVAPVGKVAPKPRQLSFEQAAVLPYPTFVAMQALREHGRVQPGQRVLVVGASGLSARSQSSSRSHSAPQ